ncbi:hypothetical protein FISHEDRAFT_37321 [Fistulina hepatica ATCC 64428]|uniref:ARM repeat-containing protein n=1 Tax=Fistulina hepatica ATCC 64428 TaxID=1128425 RepID=A0A0D7AJ64_9AGAR|nr:hypothetical protein FISHEDRAFT_37321 [Fistulina hepatica ATCC 64428]
MDPDSMSVSVSGACTPHGTLDDDERAQKSLKSYLDSLPYPCETPEQMNQCLEDIVGKLYVCAKARNWLVLSNWDGLVQCWLLLHYPMSKPVRVRLVHFYYELSLVPGVDTRTIRGWVDLLNRVLGDKPGQRRKLEPTDLQLPWRPLWRALQRELFPMARTENISRNNNNILLFLAEKCKRYFPANEIPDMLREFLPRLTKESVWTMVPVMTSFLPPTHVYHYWPLFYRLWEAYNSASVDDRMLDLVGELAEQHVAGTASGDGGAPWKDVGIWSQEEWDFIVGKGFGTMSIPVGVTIGNGSPASRADEFGAKQALRIRKTINKPYAFARLIVYSIAVDGPLKEGSGSPGYLAGSKALDTLERIITCTESFFHPTNSGPWTGTLTAFLHRLASVFGRRWMEEEQPSCRTPISQRLTPAIRKEFIRVLRTPALLAMFSKDGPSMSLAQGALRVMALLEPDIIMPEMLERAYGGLTAVNETHRTTAALTAMSAVALPLVSPKIWLPGGKHVVPLLELCIPGIDIVDPVKTTYATMFIVSVVQHLQIGDLSGQYGAPLSDDHAEGMMVDDDNEQFPIPEGTDINETSRLSLAEERALVRDSTAGFSDWVTALFRRILSFYENLPEEGGKSNTTGGKDEENVLKSIKSMMQVVCLHLSEPLFDLVLKIVYEYGTTTAKPNAVRAFGQLVTCLARANPQKTIARFLPFCVSQIEEELKHGASSTRTTSTHAAAASDTVLHWNIGILRGCLGYGGAALLPHKEEILHVLKLLVERTKSERGYTGTGRLITRIVYTLSAVYPDNPRYINTKDWGSEAFSKGHDAWWGHLYTAEEVDIEWHQPTAPEIDFILEILDTIITPALDKVDALLDNVTSWDSSNRNDFCRYLVACRNTWSGMTTIFKEQLKHVVNPCVTESECIDLLPYSLKIEAGYALTDPSDTRFQRFAAMRARFGRVCCRAADAFKGRVDGEDHVDAVTALLGAMDVYLLDYGMLRRAYDSLQRNYAQARDANRIWPKEKRNSRLVHMKRAQVYHSARVYVSSMYRQRDALDDAMLLAIAHLGMSPYLRVRRHAQSVLSNACGYFIRSTRLVLPAIFEALVKGNDPDRMKGALYMLGNKGTSKIAIFVDPLFHEKYLVSLLECQHEEKPSIQKLVNSVAQDLLTYIPEEGTPGWNIGDLPGVDDALAGLESVFSASFVPRPLLSQELDKSPVRVAQWKQIHAHTVSTIVAIALRPQTHWRYVLIALRFLYHLLRRDVPTSSELAHLFIKHTTSPQPSINSLAKRAITKCAAFIKMQTYATTTEELWQENWKSPREVQLPVHDGDDFMASLHQPVDTSGVYVDKIQSGFLLWTPTVKGFSGSGQSLDWHGASRPCIEAIKAVVSQEGYVHSVSALMAQESNRNGGVVKDLRLENVLFIKSLAKLLGPHAFVHIFDAMDPLLSDSDKFKQRAGAELLVGVLRGSKYWPKAESDALWAWTLPRFDAVFAQMKPDTLLMWESALTLQLDGWDPRRNAPLVDWILHLPLEFHGDSAFAMSKSLTLFGVLVHAMHSRFNVHADKFANIFLDNTNTNYAEIRSLMAQTLYAITENQWRPCYSSLEHLQQACESQSRYQVHVEQIVAKLPQWREERLPPPRVSFSEYDKVGLTLLLWFWAYVYSPCASKVYPYVVPMIPEILRMAELNDNTDLHKYGNGVLYILSSILPPTEYIDVMFNDYMNVIKSSSSWRIRLVAIPALVIFFNRTMMSISTDTVAKIMDMLIECLGDENIEVREMASKAVASIVRCSQRQNIEPLKGRFLAMARKATLLPRRDPNYVTALRQLHSPILGLCALIQAFPYSVEPWMPPLTDVLAAHVTDPPPISTTIRKTASEFKKTHQDTWHNDQKAFDEEQLQNLSTMLIGTSYCKICLQKSWPSLLLTPFVDA